MTYFICLLTIGTNILILLAETTDVPVTPTLARSSHSDTIGSSYTSSSILDITPSITVQSTKMLDSYVMSTTTSEDLIPSTSEDLIPSTSKDLIQSTSEDFIPSTLFTSYSFQHPTASNFSFIFESNSSLHSNDTMQETTSTLVLLVTTMTEVTPTTVLIDTTTSYITPTFNSSIDGVYTSTEQPNCTENCPHGNTIVPGNKGPSKPVIVILVIVVTVVIVVAGVFCFKKRHRFNKLRLSRSVSYRRFKDDDEQTYLQLD